MKTAGTSFEPNVMPQTSKIYYIPSLGSHVAYKSFWFSWHPPWQCLVYVNNWNVLDGPSTPNIFHEFVFEDVFETISIWRYKNKNPNSSFYPNAAKLTWSKTKIFKSSGILLIRLNIEIREKNSDRNPAFPKKKWFIQTWTNKRRRNENYGMGKRRVFHV